MFKFGFDDPDLPRDASGGSNSSEHQQKSVAKPRRVSISGQESLSNREHDVVPVGEDGELLLRKSVARVPSHLSPEGADIVPSLYEGGFKLWECAVDLTEYVIRNPQVVKGKFVLELGAGHALPAIVAKLKGAEVVHVQDYNEDVLRLVSMPNVSANVRDGMGGFAFFAGSWTGLAKVVERSYDVILSADTVYATEQVEALALCIVETLAPGGVALVAGKAYYFGVGGGMGAFAARVRHHAKAHGIALEVDTVREVRDGMSNVREISRIRRD